MGSSVSRFTAPVKDYVAGRKRKLDLDESDEAMNKIIDDALHTPKRKKLRTAHYIFQTLFKEGKNSDVTVLALGKTFHLHKIYLCQSPYFASMFGGSWLESTKNLIPIEIVDPQIIVESLNTVFGSLYLDEIVIEPLGVISILASATLFQLENIIDQCIEVMMETINPKTVVKYYNAACEYGVQKVKDETFKWLEVNLLSYYADRPGKIKKFSSQLLTRLVSSPNLFVMQTEFSVYMLLRLWLYTNVVKKVQFSNDEHDEMTRFFKSRQDQQPFLLSPEGKTYDEPFKALRLKNLLLHHMDIETIHRDNIIPRNWLHPEILHQWYSMLKINQNVDNGPKVCDESVFLKECLRCGRIVVQENKQMWRWTGFHFGLDLVVITDGSTLWVKRNHRPENEQMLSFQQQRHLIIRVTVATVDDQLQIKHMQTSGIKPISCTRNEEIPLLVFDKEINFPLFVSVNLFLTSPSNSEGDMEEPTENETKVLEVRNVALSLYDAFEFETIVL